MTRSTSNGFSLRWIQPCSVSTQNFWLVCGTNAELFFIWFRRNLPRNCISACQTNWRSTMVMIFETAYQTTFNFYAGDWWYLMPYKIESINWWFGRKTQKWENLKICGTASALNWTNNSTMIVIARIDAQSRNISAYLFWIIEHNSSKKTPAYTLYCKQYLLPDMFQCTGAEKGTW